MAGQLVVRGGQLVPGGAVLGLGDSLLALLNAHADGEVFLLHGYPSLQKHLEGVPGGVAGGQHQGVAGQGVVLLGGADLDTGKAVPLPDKPGELVLKAHLTAQGDELLADGLYHLAQDVGAHVGAVGPLHILGGTGGHQGVHHRRNAGVVGPGGELAVGEGARPSLAKLHVGGGVQGSRGPVVLHIGGAGVHIPATLQHHTGQAIPGQKQSGKQPRRAHAHHHRALGPLGAHAGKDVGLGGDQGHVALAAALHRLPLPLHGQVHGVDVVHVLLAPGVNGLPDQGQLVNGAGAHSQSAGGPAAQLF